MNKIIAITAGLATAAGITLAAGTAQASTAQPSCAAQSAAIAKVARQAGVRIGSTHLRVLPEVGPRTWARELRAAGVTDGSEWAALHIHSMATARRFIAYLEQDAAGALLGWHCSR